MTTPTTPQGWLALVIWDEARNQQRDGQAAVGRVVLNRAARHYQSDGTIVGTVLKPMQFSGFWCDYSLGKYQRVALTTAQAMERATEKIAAAQRQPILWASILDIAHDLLDGTFEGGADYDKLTDDTVLYCNLSVSTPEWATPKNFVAKIGAHTFYTDHHSPAMAA